MRRRLALASLVLTSAVRAEALLQPGRIVLFRHANAPGTGDPTDFRLDDCRTQRNLDAAGRAQAQQLGQRLRAQPVPVAAVWSSQWCRTRDTAELAFPGQWRDEPAFNSFFNEREQAAPQTARALALLRAWRGDGLLVVVTHQVNITALTGVVPASGEGVVLTLREGQVEVLGRLPP